MFDTEPTSESTARPDEFEESIAAVLSNPARKCVLATLANDESGLTLAELARAISEGDDELCSHEPAEGDEHTTAVLLYHCDLPKLSDHGLIEWDSDANRATLTTQGSACAAALGL